MVAEFPIQTFLIESAVIVGSAFTVTDTLEVPVQPLPSVPVTE
jgi:hypothetical protein